MLRDGAKEPLDQPGGELRPVHLLFFRKTVKLKYIGHVR